jgi:hypothetical protein
MPGSQGKIGERLAPAPSVINIGHSIVAAASAACRLHGQKPVAHQPQGLIGLKSASMPQHGMLADVGESGQNAKIFPYVLRLSSDSDR